MKINEESKELILTNSINFRIPGEKIKEIEEKRKYFHTNFNKEKIQNLDKDHYFLKKGVKEGNFTYELEYNSRCLGSIAGGNVFKFGYEEDFEKIKKLLVEILSANNSIDQFYTQGGELTQFSKKIINMTQDIKGIGRAFIGKVLSIYYSNVFFPIFGDQDLFLKKIYEDYKPETTGVELFLRNNYLFLEIKRKYADKLTNDEFVYLLYRIFDLKKKEIDEEDKEEDKFDALEVQHYQSLIHRNFSKLTNGKLRYYDEENQNERNGQFDTQEIGVIDFLAIDENNNFIVIEIKRHSTDATIGQILRYMGWVKKNLCKKNQQVKGIIISETKDNKLDYALSMVNQVEFKKMKLNIEFEGDLL